MRVAVHATSLGSAETLVSHPASSSHRQLTDADLAGAGLTAGTVRVSIGLEDAEDLDRRPRRRRQPGLMAATRAEVGAAPTGERLARAAEQLLRVAGDGRVAVALLVAVGLANAVAAFLPGGARILEGLPYAILLGAVALSGVAAVALRARRRGASGSVPDRSSAGRGRWRRPCRRRSQRSLLRRAGRAPGIAPGSRAGTAGGGRSMAFGAAGRASPG